MRESIAITLARGLYVLCTIGLLAAAWKIPFYGFAVFFSPSADARERSFGFLFLAPALALMLFLLGFIPPIRGRLLLWLGVIADMLALPFIVLYTAHSRGFDGYFLAFLALIYFGGWWLLVAPKLHSRHAGSGSANVA